MRLPNSELSYAVLIGTSTYASVELDDLPAVAKNLSGLAETLTDPSFGAFLPNQCLVVQDPATSRAAYRAIREYAGRAEDTLLVYWSGHGCLGPRGELYLSVVDTDIDELPVSALAVELVREAIFQSPAINRILILDSCFSGRAIPMGGFTKVLLDQVATEGTYVLASAESNATAVSPPGDNYTAFTGALLALTHNGLQGGPEFLTFAAIYSQLRHILGVRGLPRPQQGGTGNVSQLALVRNPAYIKSDPHAANTEHHVSRWNNKRKALIASAASAIVLGASLSLAYTLQNHGTASPGTGAHPGSANSSSPPSVSLGGFHMFNVAVRPEAIRDTTLRSKALSEIVSDLNMQFAAEHLTGRKVGVVQIFAAMPSTDISLAISAAAVVGHYLVQHDPVFSRAQGQYFWSGAGDNFQFFISFYE